MNQITIPSGATLSGIATTHGVSVQDILDANKGNTGAVPDVKNPNLILAGGQLNIPKPSVIQTTTSQRTTTQDRQGQLADMNARATGTVTGANLPTPGGTGGGNGATGPGGSSLDVIGPLQDQLSKAGVDPTGMDEPTMRSKIAQLNTPKNDTGTGAGSDPLSDIKKQIEDIKSNGKLQVDNMMKTLQGLASISTGSRQAQIQQINDMYGQRMKNVAESFQRLGAAKNAQDFRNGINRYTPAQGQGILTDVEVRAQMAITEIITKMNDAISKANAAQDANDTKAFNAEFDKIQTYQKSIDDQVNTLLKEATTYQNNQTRALAAAAKENQNNIKNSMDFSKRVAPAVSDAIAGLSTQKEKDAFLEKYAKDNGINPEILRGDVQAYGDSKNKKPGSPTKPNVSGSLSYTSDDLGQMENLFSQGGTVDGTTYVARNSDGYVDAGLYKAMATKWTASGGLIKDFTAKFPPGKYVDPTDNDSLPTYLQNTSKGSQTVDATIKKLGGQ